MGIRNKAILAGKVCLLVILLLVGLTLFGCGVSSSPQGGSGGTIADGTLFLCPTLKQATGGFGCAAPSGQPDLGHGYVSFLRSICSASFRASTANRLSWAAA